MLIWDHFRCKICSFLEYQKPSARCCETRGQHWPKMRVENAKTLLRLGALSEQKWVLAWVLKFSVFQRPSWSLQKSIWIAFLGSKWGPKTVRQNVFFRVPTSRHDYWKKCTPPRRKPCFCMLTRFENGSIWGSKIDQKSLVFRHPSWKWFLLILERKWRFWEAKTEAKFQQKSIPRRFAWSVEKCIAQAVLCQSRRLGPEASPGGPGGGPT